ncbi:MAG: DUF2147 domain-containing protein [Micavibrio sp.]|nr:DUF2147 domain-containing protein [Micavibrio sp.]
MARNTLREMFNRQSLALTARRYAAAVGLGVTVAATAAPEAYSAPVTAPNEETLWKTQKFDAVIALRPCDSSGVCGEIRWVNPDDSTITDYFGDPARRSGDADSRAEVEALCGFSPHMQVKDAGPGRWQGQMDLRGMNMTVNVDAQKVSDQQLKVVFSKGIFSRTENWTRVEANDPRYPACKKPVRTP